MTDLAERGISADAIPDLENPLIEADQGPQSEADQSASILGKRRWSSVMAFILAVLVVGAATWFSNAESVQSTAAHGVVGVRAEATLSASAVARNRLAQALLLHTATELGVAEVQDYEASLESVRTALGELTVRSERLRADSDGAGGIVHERTGELIAALTRTFNALSDGDVEAAGSLMVDVDELFVEAAAELTAIRDSSMSQIIVARDTAGQVAVGSRIVVAFLLPLAAVLLYRYAATRAARRRELEHALERERSTLKAKDELIANISHELRTPLTGILGFAQTAASEDDLEAEDLRFMAQMIAGEADELSRMIDDLITTARDDESEVPVVIDVMDPNEELASVLIPAKIAGRHIDTDLQPGKLLADRLRFRQVVRNLLSNALKYGGPTVLITGQVVGERYLVAVVDDGDGVGDELESRLFTRFVHQGETPLLTGSVGLGTSIAHRLAVLMDGSLEYSRHDGFTFFTLGLPLATEQRATD